MILPFRRYSTVTQTDNAAREAEAEQEVRVRQAKLVERTEGAAGTIVTYLDLPA